MEYLIIGNDKSMILAKNIDVSEEEQPSITDQSKKSSKVWQEEHQKVESNGNSHDSTFPIKGKVRKMHSAIFSFRVLSSCI